MAKAPARSLAVLQEAARHLRRPQRLTVAQWAERYRIISAESNPEPGPWTTATVPYLREPMETISRPDVEEVVFMGPSQVGKTELELNIVGYFVHQEPCPILIVLPTADAGEAWSRERLAPMFRDTPVLAGRLEELRSRDAHNKAVYKKFPGGYLAIVGANSPSALAMRPIRVVIFDEIAKYPASAGAEGDPIKLAEKRTARFPNRKHVKVSSPKFQNGDIHREYLRSDRRRYWVACPHCGEFQVLHFRIGKDEHGNPTHGGLEWPPGHPERAFYRCEHCGGEIPDDHKPEMLSRGQWRAENPASPVAGFWLHGLYSPFVSWGKLATEFETAKDDPLQLQVFINTSLGEPWKEGLSDEHLLPKLRERAKMGTYQPAADKQSQQRPWDVPDGVGLLTAAADVQENRVEILLAGWGAGEEFWPIAYEIVWGNTQDKATWEEVDTFLLREWKHQHGAVMRPAITLIDSGNQTDAVYDFVLTRQTGARRVYAVKGVQYLAQPQLVVQGTTKRAQVRLFTGSTTAAKDKVFSRLQIPRPGPGYFHLPAWATDEWLEQLASEAKVPTLNKVTRSVVRRWVQVHSRNEVLDCAVYNFFALFVLQNFIGREYRDLAGLAKKLSDNSPPDPAPAGRRVRRFEL